MQEEKEALITEMQKNPPELGVEGCPGSLAEALDEVAAELSISRNAVEAAERASGDAERAAQIAYDEHAAAQFALI